MISFLKICILGAVVVYEHQKNTFVNGFSSSTRRPQQLSRRTTATTIYSYFMEKSSDFGSAMPEPISVYESIGIEEGKLALGIKPEEFQKYIGTRGELLEKTMTDIPKLGRKDAEMEVDKFLMDAEMVNLYIQYGKEIEKNPDFKVPGANGGDDDTGEGLFSIRTLLILYIAYAFGNSGLGFFRNYVNEQQAAGTWDGTNIPFIDQWIEQTTKVAVDVATVSSDVVSDTVAFNNISPEMVHDVITSVGSSMTS